MSGRQPMAPPPPGTGPFPGQPNSETFGPGHPVFHPPHGHGNPDPDTRLPPGSVPPGARFDPIGPDHPGVTPFKPDDDHLRPPQ